MKILGRIVIGILVLTLVAAVIGWLALRRPDIPYATLEARYANAESQYLDLADGLKVHYRDQGKADGPVLVMVHGFSASLHTWEPWVAILGKDYRIITLDLPGHGLTRAPDGYLIPRTGFVEIIDAVVSRLGVSRFTLIGNSMGGGAAWQYALAHPGKLEGLVLVNAAGWPREGEAAEGSPIAFRILRNPVGRFLVKDLDASAMTRQGLRSAFEPTPDMADEAMVTRYVEFARAPGHREIILGLMSGEPEYATTERLAAIKVPTLVIHGDTDLLIPASAAQKFGATIPGSTVIIYEKVGHVPMEQIADRSAGDLAVWLRSIRTGPV